jgi:AraC family transcriptional regulator, transcriptional activator of pobA
MPMAVPFREVRHEQPEDCLHHEAIDVRGRIHGWSIPAHRHENLHQFQLLSRGSACITLDTEVHDVAAPFAVMIAPGTVHRFVYQPDSEGQQVTVPTALLRQALSNVSSLMSGLYRSLLLQPTHDETALLAERFHQLADEYASRSPGRSEALQAQSLMLALWFLRQAGVSATDAHQHALRDTLVRRFRALLEFHYRDHWSLQDYAGELQVSADHLSKACKAITGQSALELVQERLLLEARRLLAFGSATVQQVALELGFEDASYFSRFFSRRAGQSPSAYRVAVALGMAPRAPA